jgi:hypothetical protein
MIIKQIKNIIVININININILFYAKFYLFFLIMWLNADNIKSRLASSL